MLSCTKVNLDCKPEGHLENKDAMKASSNRIGLLKKEYWFKMTGDNAERLASTIEIGKEKMEAKIQENYPSFISKLLLQSLCRLQETEVLVYVRDSDVKLMKTLVIPWTTQEYIAKTGISVRAQIDHNFRLNNVFKGRVVISNADRSLWVDNDVIAKIGEVAKAMYDRRTIKDETKGTLRYMRR